MQAAAHMMLPNHVFLSTGEKSRMTVKETDGWTERKIMSTSAARAADTKSQQVLLNSKKGLCNTMHRTHTHTHT